MTPEGVRIGIGFALYRAPVEKHGALRTGKEECDGDRLQDPTDVQKHRRILCSHRCRESIRNSLGEGDRSGQKLVARWADPRPRLRRTAPDRRVGVGGRRERCVERDGADDESAGAERVGKDRIGRRRARRAIELAARGRKRLPRIVQAFRFAQCQDTEGSGSGREDARRHPTDRPQRRSVRRARALGCQWDWSGSRRRSEAKRSRSPEGAEATPEPRLRPRSPRSASRTTGLPRARRSCDARC